MGRGKETRVAIIGGGLSGITLALELKKRLGLKNLTIFEKAAEPGGTWRDNTYPGCACDVPSHWYSLSTEQNPWWTAKYSPQPEIHEYWKNIHAKHKLQDHTSYNSTFEAAYWNKEKQLYEVHLKRTTKPEHTWVVEAEVLVSAIGGFSTPLDAPPSLPGLLDFKGERFHSARWNHQVDLKNKTIGVIGNGCSGAQFLPVIAQEASSKCINFSRTPSWFMPRDQGPYPTVVKWMFAYVPFVMKAYRGFMASTLDARFVAWYLNNSMIRHYVEEFAIKYIKDTSPEKYHEFLVPTYPFACKRVILDPGYLKCLHQPNVELVTDRIDKVTEKGILGKSGKEYPLDVLILATGFDVTARGLGINVHGRHGKNVTQQWDEQNGPQAYLGTAISGFPNFYTILGPNVATGHASVISSTESQVNYIVEMVRPIYQGRVTSLELKQDAEERYNRQLKHRLNKTVWSGCDSYYKLDNGKIVATFPGTLTEFWWNTRTPNFEHYVAKNPKGFLSLALRARLLQITKLIAFILAIISIRRYGARRLGLEISIFLMQQFMDLRSLLARK